MKSKKNAEDLDHYLNQKSNEIHQKGHHDPREIIKKYLFQRIKKKKKLLTLQKSSVKEKKKTNRKQSGWKLIFKNIIKQ